MKTEGSKNVSCVKEIVFELAPNDMPPIMIDEKPYAACYLTMIEEGLHRGTWLFTSKERAEEFAWKRGLKYVFESAINHDETEDLL